MGSSGQRMIAEHVERVEGFDRIDMINRIEKRFLAVVSLEFEV